MTAGYDPLDPATPITPKSEHGAAERFAADRFGAARFGAVRREADREPVEDERPGPLPPRMHSSGSFPTVTGQRPSVSRRPPAQAAPAHLPAHAAPTQAVPAPSGPPVEYPLSGPPLSAPPGGQSGWSRPAGPPPPTHGYDPGHGQQTGGFRVPGAPSYSGPSTSSFPAAPVSALPGYGPPGPGQVTAHGRRPLELLSGRWVGTVGLGLALVLVLVAAVQTFFIVGLNNQLGAERRKAAEAKSATDGRFGGVEGRAGNLEKRVLDPQAVAKDVLQSVVVVFVPGGLGSGFAIGKGDGGATTMVTNFHVVEKEYDKGVRVVQVGRDRIGQRYSAKILEVERTADLALLQVDEVFAPLTVAKAPAQPGQPVMVVGAPLGLDNTVTTGVVSAVRQSPISRDYTGPLVQFDAATNQGNSGGPVVNAQREVVGIVLLVIRAENNQQGMNFAIPVEVLCKSFSKVC